MSGEKILLVEDNEVNRRLAEFLLRSQGYEVTEAASASFENAWPKAERAREPALPRRTGRAPSRFTDADSEDRSAATTVRHREARA